VLLHVHIPSTRKHLDQTTRPAGVAKMLLHRTEIERIERRTTRRAHDRAALALLQGRPRQVEIALARGKKTYDKRPAIAERTATRERSATSVDGSRGWASAGCRLPGDRPRAAFPADRATTHSASCIAIPLSRRPRSRSAPGGSALSIAVPLVVRLLVAPSAISTLARPSEETKRHDR